jgi:hypothetical protein
MSTLAASDPVEQAGALHRAMQEVSEVTVQFPVSQLLVPMADTLDWLLDDVATERYWLDALRSLHKGYAVRWERIAQRALEQLPRQVSDRAFGDADYCPLDGAAPVGVELTRVLRAVYAELEEFGDEASGVFPTDERTRAFVRAIRTQTGVSVLPVLSYMPLLESEWHAILDKLNDLIELALLFEGAVVVWVIGGFARDVDGRLQLRPQLSFAPPPRGTRVKPLRVLLGTAYEEQCPSLIPLVHAVRGAQSRPSDALLTETSWHRLVVQLDVTAEDYVLLNLDHLSDAEREMARQIMNLDRQPRELHALEGPVGSVPRPWQPANPAAAPEATPPDRAETTLLPPRPAMQAARQSPAVPVAPPDAASLQRDAEALRRKGMAAVKTDPAIAQKYLLSSTLLENTSVDVWLTLVDIASNDKQKESFRREAEKVLQRQRRLL